MSPPSFSVSFSNPLTYVFEYCDINSDGDGGYEGYVNIDAGEYVECILNIYINSSFTTLTMAYNQTDNTSTCGCIFNISPSDCTVTYIGTDFFGYNTYSVTFNNSLSGSINSTYSYGPYINYAGTPFLGLNNDGTFTLSCNSFSSVLE
jgi:hypothetical protein